jgi:hypothetical protein
VDLAAPLTSSALSPSGNRRAGVIDFPSAALAPHHLEATHPDDFVLDLLDLAEP